MTKASPNPHPARKWYNRVRTPSPVGTVTRTKQAFKNECDINYIMKKYERTGLIDHVSKYQGEYCDFTDAPASYHEAMIQIAEANEMFLTIPASIRDQFGNDPGRFLDFVSDPANEGEMREIGLLPAKPGTDIDADGVGDRGQRKSAGAMAVDGSETPPSPEAQNGTDGAPGS